MGMILVVDDDENCRDAMQMILEREGYDVLSAADVDHALSALAEYPFDLVYCDYRMPGKSGLDLLAEIHRSNPSLPVFMVSAQADSEFAAAARRLGAAGLLQKPLRRQQLVEHAVRSLNHLEGNAP
jgi:two-component system response regulator PilR (NtrC family)